MRPRSTKHFDDGGACGGGPKSLTRWVSPRTRKGANVAQSEHSKEVENLKQFHDLFKNKKRLLLIALKELFV